MEGVKITIQDLQELIHVQAHTFKVGEKKVSEAIAKKVMSLKIEGTNLTGLEFILEQKHTIINGKQVYRELYNKFLSSLSVLMFNVVMLTTK